MLFNLGILLNDLFFYFVRIGLAGEGGWVPISSLGIIIVLMIILINMTFPRLLLILNIDGR